jgi:hypothetical protein
LPRSLAKLALIGGTLALALTPAAAQAGGKTHPPKTCKTKKQKKCPKPVEGRMTGHGHQFNVNGWDKVQWEFRNTVCNEQRFPDLKVEFGKNKFILTSYSSGPMCFTFNPAAGPQSGQPAAGFDSFRGTGTGTLNGVPGAGITFQFTDLGEPGRSDLADFTITAPNGGIAYSGGAIDGGNHQAHRK